MSGVIHASDIRPGDVIESPLGAFRVDDIRPPSRYNSHKLRAQYIFTGIILDGVHKGVESSEAHCPGDSVSRV